MQLLQRADLIAEHLRRHFHLHFHLVESVLAGQDDLVMRQRALDLQQRGLHLRRKDIDAANNQHVVAAAADAPYAPQSPAARAWPGKKRRDVARAIADHRHGLLAEGGQHQLALLAVGQQLAGLRIDDLRVKMIFEDVQAIMLWHSTPTPGPMISESPYMSNAWILL